MKDSQAVLARLIIFSCLLLGLGRSGAGQQADFAPNKDPKTGIEIGQLIPPFQLVDQFGKQQNFNTLKGPRGAVLIFFRSADW